MEEEEEDEGARYLRRGSLGPSTVILMARWYVATWGGLVNTVMVRVKLFPGGGEEERRGRERGEAREKR